LIGAWANNELEKHIAISLSEKRIRHYSNNDMAKLMELMGEWRFLLGVSSQASDRELIMMTKYVSESYPQLTYTDIRTTMMMAMQGKLDIAFTPMINFSAKYVSDCINDYCSHKSRFINEALHKQDKKDAKAENKPKNYTPEERMNIFASILTVAYNMAHNLNEVMDFENRIYKWLRHTKQIKMSQDDINEAIKYGESKYRKLYGAKRDEESPDRIKKYGREHAVVKYFLSVPLSEIMSKINVEYFKIINNENSGRDTNN
jgi:hypothetical protein